MKQVKNGDIILTDKMKSELESLKKRPIDLSDTPEITEWQNSVVGKFYRPVKKQVTACVLKRR